jgi:hypothetical protein
MFPVRLGVKLSVKKQLELINLMRVTLIQKQVWQSMQNNSKTFSDRILKIR